MTSHPRWHDDAIRFYPWGTAPVVPPPDRVIFVRLYRPLDRGFVGSFWASADDDSIGGFSGVSGVSPLDSGYLAYWQLAASAGKTPGQIVRWWSGKGNGITFEVSPLLEGTFQVMKDSR